MKVKSNILDLLHEIREKHYSQTKKYTPKEIEKEFKKECEKLMKNLGLNYFKTKTVIK